jgi:hypothetical protein
MKYIIKHSDDHTSAISHMVAGLLLLFFLFPPRLCDDDLFIIFYIIV